MGQTKRKVSERWSSHKHDSKKVDNYFYRAIRKYGIQNFELVILETWDSLDEANEAERWWIKILDTTNRDFGYNGLLGGAFQPTVETGRKISEAKKKSFQNNPQLRENIRQSKLGKKLSQEHADKVKKNLTRGWWTGKKHTDEQKAHLSLVMKEIRSKGIN